jgi:hypothetical protein
MRTSEDWYAAYASDSFAESTKKWLERAGAEVLWLRHETEKRVQARRGHFVMKPCIDSLVSGYLFFRGRDPSDLREMPGCPYFVRADGQWARVRAARMAHLQFMIGDREILRKVRHQYLVGDKALYENFKASVVAVKNTATGQEMRLEVEILGKSAMVDVASPGVELVPA